MDEREQRIERFDRLQQLDRRNCVDGFDFDHPGLSGLEIDGAVNVDALTPARLLNRELVLFGRPAADRPRRMGRMHRVGEQHGARPAATADCSISRKKASTNFSLALRAPTGSI